MTRHVFNERQQRMILERKLEDSVIATRLGISAREVKRQRARLEGDAQNDSFESVRASA